jgi:hypothetical protein
MSTTVKWQPEPNTLTTPTSCRARHIPNTTLGYDELSQAIAKRNALWSAGLVKSVLLEAREEIKEQLINGNKINLEHFFSVMINLAVRLESADSPMPPAAEVIKLLFAASRNFLDEVRTTAQLERIAPENKVPVIASVRDTQLDLQDVLNPDGVLDLAGADMLFTPGVSDVECVLEGTRSGRTVQTRFAKISNTEVLIVPTFAAQTDVWNNEYTLSISTRYTKHGSLRTGVYNRPLRTPLTIDFSENHYVGMLSGPQDGPLVEAVVAELVAAESVRVRIQAAINPLDGELRLSLLDMTEGGSVGNAVIVSANGEYTLQGLSGSALTSLTVQVNEYATLKEMVQTVYFGRLVDILTVLRHGS